MTPITPCQCSRPGWCERHQCLKTPLLHRICQEDPDRFAEWERGEGVRLPLPQQPAALPDGPGLLQRASNFGQALMDHARSGFSTVADDEYHRRLEICRGCTYCEIAALICRHRACGCRLTVKARWASSTCPISQWSVVETVSLES